MDMPKDTVMLKYDSIAELENIIAAVAIVEGIAVVHAGMDLIAISQDTYDSLKEGFY